jgi:hypothetical protein
MVGKTVDCNIHADDNFLNLEKRGQIMFPSFVTVFLAAIASRNHPIPFRTRK